LATYLFFLIAPRTKQNDEFVFFAVFRVQVNQIAQKLGWNKSN